MQISGSVRHARCIFLEIIEGRGTEHGGVWLDTKDIVGWDKLQYDRARSYIWPKRFGVDTTRFEVAPTYHFTIGGVRFNARAESTVDGLLVAGEVARGIHGANRIAGNALTECMVFGAIAGETAAQHTSRPRRWISPAQVQRCRQEVLTLSGASYNTIPVVFPYVPLGERVV